MGQDDRRALGAEERAVRYPKTLLTNATPPRIISPSRPHLAMS